MKNIVLSTVAAATVLFTATTSFADGHSRYEVAVPAGLCQETKDFLARWAYGKPEFTTFAVPTSKTARCGEKGERVTAGIAQSADLKVARKAALEVCNANRGDLGRCVVIGTVRLK